jgi:hypothetical protein
MTLTPDVLRAMEEASLTDLDLQKNMATVDECGSAGLCNSQCNALF